MTSRGYKRPLLLGLVLLIVAGFASGYLRFTTVNPRLHPVAADSAAKTDPRPERSPDITAFLLQAVEASKIDDRLQRCLHMPDPPGSHWHADAVAAYCRYYHAPSLTPAHFRELIAAGKGDEVDRELSGYLEAQKQGAAHDGELDGALARLRFSEATPEMLAAIDAWKKQRPDSPFALAANGTQYYDLAWKGRGSGYASETNEEQWTTAHNYAMRSVDELQRALSIQPDIMPAYAKIFGMASMAGDKNFADATVQRGLARQPASLPLRLIRVGMSGEKWGGTIEDVHGQADEAARLAVDHPLLWVVVGRAHIDIATHEGRANPVGNRFLDAAIDVAPAGTLSNLANRAWHARKNNEALVLAVEAMRFDNSDGEALYNVGGLTVDTRWAEWSRAQLQEAARDYPESASVAGNAGVRLRALGDSASAEKLLNVAVERDPKNDWYLTQLGSFYSHEGKRYDKAGEIAEELIRRDPDNSSGYVIRACVQIETDHPDRYRTIAAFLDRYGDDPDEATPVSQMRAYLQEHPEPSASKAKPTRTKG